MSLKEVDEELIGILLTQIKVIRDEVEEFIEDSARKELCQASLLTAMQWLESAPVKSPQIKTVVND